eukprot:Rmarinus@m.26295
MRISLGLISQWASRTTHTSGGDHARVAEVQPRRGTASDRGCGIGSNSNRDGELLVTGAVIVIVVVIAIVIVIVEEQMTKADLNSEIVRGSSSSSDSDTS